jgi:dihydroorotate dehydrogenase
LCGSRLEDVQLFNAHRSANIKIKASGGIKELDVALSLITAGAQRLGVSAAGALLHSFEQVPRTLKHTLRLVAHLKPNNKRKVDNVPEVIAGDPCTFGAPHDTAEK